MLRRPRVVVPFDRLLEAFEFVSFGPPEEHQAFVCLETGRSTGIASLETTRNSCRKILTTLKGSVAIPHKNDLDVGKNLVFEFIEEVLPDAMSEVERMFSRRGAYSNFKNLLERRGLLPRWYEYEATAQEKAMREWCADPGIEIGVTGT